MLKTLGKMIICRPIARHDSIGKYGFNPNTRFWPKKEVKNSYGGSHQKSNKNKER